MESLKSMNVVEPLKKYILSGGAYFGICLGMQVLFSGSEESPGVAGLSIIEGEVKKFSTADFPVPHIGWDSTTQRQASVALPPAADPQIRALKYFVHSYLAPVLAGNESKILTTTTYGGETFVSSVQDGKLLACQFHPEKSGAVDLDLVRRYLEAIEGGCEDLSSAAAAAGAAPFVRSEEPEVSHLTSFRTDPSRDLPLQDLLLQASKNVFIPLTVGGGIRDFVTTDPTTGK